MNTTTMLESRPHPAIGNSQSLSNRYEMPTVQAVAQLAYAHFVAYGRQDGHDVQQWLAAEAHLHAPYRRICLRDVLSP